MTGTMLLLDPTAPLTAPIQQDSQKARRVLDKLAGTVIGIIDNAKPNFDNLADELSHLLVSRYGVKQVLRHRKRGQVPVGDAVMNEMSGQCDGIITGSGD